MAETTRREHVIRSVLGALIVAAVVGPIGFWHKEILSGIAAAWEWTFASVETTRIWYWFLTLWFLVTLSTIINLAWSARWKRPEFFDYKEDSFFGITWRWG